MFSNSKIDENNGCRCTKCISIIKNMAMNTILELAARCKDRTFYISTDGSNNCNNKKLYPTVYSKNI